MHAGSLQHAQLPVATAIDRGACGVGFVADRFGRASVSILQRGLTALINLQHRGGIGADNETGDGAGVLTSLPTGFFARELERLTGKTLPPDRIAVGMLFLRLESASWARHALADALHEQGCSIAGWRTVPIHPEVLGPRARRRLPLVEQALLVRPARMTAEEYERRLFVARKAFERRALSEAASAYVVSLSARTVVYKGLLYAPQLSAFYPDLIDPDFEVSSVVFHQRYSTNTLPSWERAQPLRVLCHNGEINTVQGNVAWALARTAQMRREFDVGPHLTPETIAPVIDLAGSDSAMLDNYAELLHHAGRDLRHVFAMLLPMAWEKLVDLPPKVRNFYAYHAYLQEPWDGPAAVVFSDGALVGATLDRNGLRPLRYAVADDGLVFASSEIGAVPVDAAQLQRIGKLGPGQMLAVDTRKHAVYESKEIKTSLAARRPYGEWVRALPYRSRTRGAARIARNGNPARLPATLAKLATRQVAFGYTRDDMAFMLKPMVEQGVEPVGSMGDDTPPAVLSSKPRPLFDYFRQRFAEVTNPAIDPLREALVMSLSVRLGARGNALSTERVTGPFVTLRSPILTETALQELSQQQALPVARMSSAWPAAAELVGMARALDGLRARARSAFEAGSRLLVLSDRGASETEALIPSLLAVSAVHHGLIRAGARSEVSLVVDSGEPRSVHDVAALIGYGANAVCPYLALETVADLGSDGASAQRQYVQALEKGLLKVMSKMGISTLDAYCGAQVFECVGLAPEVVEAYFTGTPAHLGGATLADIARIVLTWHALAYPNSTRLPTHGLFKFKRAGELHAFSPDLVKKLHSAVRTPDALGSGFREGYHEYCAFRDAAMDRPPIHVRDLLEVRPFTSGPIPVKDVEPRESLVQRFSTAAMSHGSLSSEVHETLAIAMNRMGAASNSGEGGEDVDRFSSERNSRVKQVASGRFGVTPVYLLSADELQIKIAQGAKPGEGGQLPGHKVTAEIAAIRHAQAGIALISPPPHHDIYSIEDIAQLIFDLRQVNPKARVSVKLVAQAGVGIIAAGVAKAGADVIVIAGHSGGTGAAAWSSIKHVGIPWEIGLGETQRALIRAGLRGRVRVRVDGGLFSGRDVLTAAALGADEYSFGTSALIAAGCVMARTCHTNNCPVGIATQRDDLRAKFAGTPEQVMAYMHFVAEDVREQLAAVGARRIKHIIGRTDLLFQAQSGAPGEPRVDLRALLGPPLSDDRTSPPEGEQRYLYRANPTARLDGLNESLLDHATPALHAGQPITLRYSTTNRTRTFGATLSGAITRLHGPRGLPSGTVHVTCHGTAGQSFGAFLAPGLQLALHGAANDYVGKGMAGGRITIVPPDDHNGALPVLAGNTVLYGATGGELYVAGRVGERFAVRNSGAQAVVEGVGDHGCEYMTGGQVVILGEVGHNFAAGMTGGVAYVYDRERRLERRLNRELVVVEPLALDEGDVLRDIVARHAELTGSPLASRLLNGWESALATFVRVRPAAHPSTLPYEGFAEAEAVEAVV